MRLKGGSLMSETQQTHPFDPRECISRSDAAKKAGVTGGTISGWCEKYGIGRRIGGHWKISKVALRMHLEGAYEALAAYHAGARTDPKVVRYFVQEGLEALITPAALSD
jgi:hypothetical protein